MKAFVSMNSKQYEETENAVLCQNMVTPGAKIQLC